MSENKVEGVIEKGGNVKRNKLSEDLKTLLNVQLGQLTESSYSAQPSPGASPTEDGLVEKALRVMGAKYGTASKSWYIRRVGTHLDVPIDWECPAALFIHEAEQFLGEHHFNEFKVAYFRDHVSLVAVRHHPQSWEEEDGGARIYTGPRPTKHEAYAQAVIQASGIEPTTSEPNEEQGVSTENASSGGQG